MEKVELKAPPPGMAPAQPATPVAKQPAKEAPKEAPPTSDTAPPKKKPAQKKVRYCCHGNRL